MKTPSVLRKTAAGVALVGLLAIGYIPASMAAPEGDGTAAPVDATTVEKTKTGSLIIHKHERTGENGKEPGNGKAPKDTSKLGAPIKGIEFCAQKVKSVDLSTNAGWQTVANLNNDISKAKELGLEDAKKATTDEQGVANISALPLGLYYVTECGVSGAEKNGKKVSVVPAAPFLVTIPMTDPDSRNTWMYDINVYPKNSLSGITKTAEDKKVTVGEKSSFTLTAKVPKPENGKDLTKFVMMDVWRDADKLKFLEENGDLTLSVEGGSVTLAATTDYTVAKRDSTPEKSGYVTITFTEAGLKKLSEAAKTADISVKAILKLQVTAMPTENGVLKNWPFLSPSSEYSDTPPDNPEKPTPTPPGPDTPDKPTPTPPVPGDPVEEKFGKVVIKKFKTGDTTKKQLAGAKFKLYYCDDKSKPLSVNGVSDWTTEENKDLEISGIQASDFYNGQKQTALLEYCLVETDAPAGYEKLAEPIKFEVKSEGVTDATPSASLDVPNSPANGGFHLPLTGSTALIVVSLSGLVIIAGGLTLAWRRRRANA